MSEINGATTVVSTLPPPLFLNHTKIASETTACSTSSSPVPSTANSV